MTEKRKAIIIRVDADFHQKLKMYAVKQDITMQEYVKNLIEKDLKNKESGEN